MQLTLDQEDINNAPEAVRSWLAKFINVPTPPKPAPDTPLQAPAIEQVIEAAMKLLESKGEDVLQEVLNKVGVDRVKNCPADKRAELLAEIAVHA
ncbi:MAG: hypothetical protein AAGJ40_02700 [Planctomycetota bacterium]